MATIKTYTTEKIDNLIAGRATSNHKHETYDVNGLDGTLTDLDGRITTAQGTANTGVTNAAQAAQAAAAAKKIANDAYSLASGRVKAFSFATKAAMTTALKAANDGTYKVGDSLYIKEANTPDYWVSNVLTTNTGTYGYYEITELEGKIDLTAYQTKTDTNLSVGDKTTVVGAINYLWDQVRNKADSVTLNNLANVTKRNDFQTYQDFADDIGVKGSVDVRGRTDNTELCLENDRITIRPPQGNTRDYYFPYTKTDLGSLFAGSPGLHDDRVAVLGDIRYIKKIIDDHKGASNPHGITKTTVGLGNVDNTSDLAKPISTAVQNALNGKANSSHAHTIANITGLETKLGQFNDAISTLNESVKLAHEKVDNKVTVDTVAGTITFEY